MQHVGRRGERAGEAGAWGDAGTQESDALLYSTHGAGVGVGPQVSRGKASQACPQFRLAEAGKLKPAKKTICNNKAAEAACLHHTGWRRRQT